MERVERAGESTSGDRPIRVSRIEDVRRRSRRVAIGTFDGVHLGHRDVVRGCDTVLTFAPHPLRVVRPDRAPDLLTTLGRKIARLSALGVREVVIIPFDRSRARQTPEALVEEVLVDALAASEVSVGFNFRFGAGGTGTTSDLRRDDRFRTRVVPGVTAGSGIVSSTGIRELVRRGDVVRAARLLAAPLVQPAVVSGDRTVRFPAGLALPTAGLYRVGIGEVTARMSFDRQPPRLLGRAGTPEPGGRITDITFLDRADAPHVREDPPISGVRIRAVT